VLIALSLLFINNVGIFFVNILLINNTKRMLAYVFIILGSVFLMKNLGLLSMINWDVVWPIALIALGALMLFKKKNW